ncbi:6-O-methylguanine DNA methyltransferase [Gaertneriomyces semiglobifer]|nr:6-O-methylguanine DNA methyltransferase [Gaertneriomyces semiglobifer]
MDSIDMSTSQVTPFQRRVYELCAQIPPGYFSTYKEISDALKSSPRAVGQALKKNPFAPTVPCHRVISSDYRIGGFFGQWAKGSNVDRKHELLRQEGVLFADDGCLPASARTELLFRAFVL